MLFSNKWMLKRTAYGMLLDQTDNQLTQRENLSKAAYISPPHPLNYTTQILACTGSLFDGRHQMQMTPILYIRTVVPFGLLYSLSLVCSIEAYLYLSVAYTKCSRYAITEINFGGYPQLQRKLLMVFT